MDRTLGTVPPTEISKELTSVYTHSPLMCKALRKTCFGISALPLGSNVLAQRSAAMVSRAMMRYPVAACNEILNICRGMRPLNFSRMLLPQLNAIFADDPFVT